MAEFESVENDYVNFLIYNYESQKKKQFKSYYLRMGKLYCNIKIIGKCITNQ